MKINKKHSGGDYYDNYYEPNLQKQYYFNHQTDQEFDSFSKNKTFDPYFNNSQKGKQKRQNQKMFNNKRIISVNFF